LFEVAEIAKEADGTGAVELIGYPVQVPLKAVSIFGVGVGFFLSLNSILVLIGHGIPSLGSSQRLLVAVEDAKTK